MIPTDLQAFVSDLMALLQEVAADAATQAPGSATQADPQRGLRFLMAAYTAVWVILAAYILSLSVRLRRLARQVRRLKERLGP